MNPKKTIKRLGLALLVFFSILLTVFVINQFVSFYNLLRAIHPTLAKLILGILLLFLTYFIFRLILSLLSRPKALTLRENPTEDEYRQYLLAMTTILAKNHHVHPEIKALKQQNQLQFIAALLGESLTSAAPGLAPLANLVTSSIMEGALNAFFILRIGSIAQSYLGMETPETKVQIRKRASRLAIANLGGIIADNGKLVVKAVTRAVRKAGSRTARKWFGFGQTDTVE